MIRCTQGTRICYVGTSITTGVPPATQTQGWYVTPMQLGRALYYGPGYALSEPRSATGAIRFNTAVGGKAKPLQVGETNVAGIAGGKLQDLIDNWASLVVAREPFDVLFVEGDINDTHAGTTNPAYTALVQQILALGAKYSQIAWLGQLLGFLGTGEDSTTFGDAFNTDLEAKNAIVAAQVAAVGGTFIDARPAFKAWEIANNPGHLGSGLLTTDGVHLSATGLALIRDTVWPFFQWGGT